MQEVLIVRVYSARITKSIIITKIIKVIAQEVLNKDGISIIVQEEQLSLLFKG